MAEEAIVPIGWKTDAVGESLLSLPFADLASHHMIVLGPTGSGKSGFLLSLILGLATRYPHAGLIVVDAKGETAANLRDVFFPSLHSRYPHVRPERVTTVTPFGKYGVKLNPLFPIGGIEPEVQANILCGIVDTLVDGGLGMRARSILGWLARAVIQLSGGGSLHDVLRLLREEETRGQIASRIPDQEVARYLMTTLQNEPQSSMDSLRARLEHLLLLPQMRGMLCAPGCISGLSLIESPIVLVDLGNAPQGFSAAAKFIGSFVFSLLTAGVFARPVRPNMPPVFLIIDEWQQLVGHAATELEDLLSLCRYKGIGLVLANQHFGQIRQVSPALVESVLTNTAYQMFFRPTPETLKEVQTLIPVTGTCRDPEYADRLLSRRDELATLSATYSRLPPRHGLFINRKRGTSQVIRTLSIPYAEAAERVGKCSPALRESFVRGNQGIPFSELLTKNGQRDNREVALGIQEAETEADSGTSAGRRRPKLEIS